MEMVIEVREDGKWDLWDEDGTRLATLVVETVWNPIAITDGVILTASERKQRGARMMAAIRAELRAEGVLPRLRLVR